jgi:hypothetical protein
MDDAFDPAVERRARRLGIGVRLVLYPMALGLIVLAWQHYHGDPSQAEATNVVNWRGLTRQSQAVQAGIRERRLMFLDTNVLERCSDGSVFTLHWYPGQHRFVQHGEYLYGHHGGRGRANNGQPTVWDARLWARIGAHPGGAIRARTSWTGRHGAVSCDSGPVWFALHPSR